MPCQWVNPKNRLALQLIGVSSYVETELLSQITPYEYGLFHSPKREIFVERPYAEPKKVGDSPLERKIWVQMIEAPKKGRERFGDSRLE